MTRNGLRLLLAWGVVAALLLPVLLVVMLGLAALLGALGDSDGAIACGRAAIVVGVLWLAALVVTVAVNAMLTLSAGIDRSPGHGRRGRPRRRRLAVRGERPGLGEGRSPGDRGSGGG